MLPSLCVLLAACVATSTAALPEGFMAYFDAPACPQGWQPHADSQGRVIVSVANNSVAGVTVGAPLSDQEDRVHTHSLSGSLTFAEKDVAAIDCCNDQGAHEGAVDWAGTTHNTTSGLPFLQLLLCRLSADNATLNAPFATVGFFDTNVETCPPQWSPVDQAAGRAMVPSYTPLQGFFPSPAKPLASGEVRSHTHTVSTSFNTSDVEYVGVEGCCNKDTARAGVVDVAGDGAASTDGIPYIQLLTCVFQGEEFTSSLPREILLFNTIFCEQGWEYAVGMSGRMLVALPNGGTVGATFGGKELPAKAVSQPSHAHVFSSSVTPPTAGVGLDSGCCGNGYAGHQT